MMLQLHKNDFLLKAFTIATIVHILCSITKIITSFFLSSTQILDIITAYLSLSTTICMIIIMSITLIDMFTLNHQYVIKKDQFIGIFIDSCIVVIVIFCIVFNQEIASYLIQLLKQEPQQTHNNKILYIIMFILIYLSYQLYRTSRIKTDAVSDISIEKIMWHKIVTIALQICIMTCIILDTCYPITKIMLAVDQWHGFILYLTTPQFILYIHTMIMILLGLWIAIIIYYLYEHYQNK